MKYPIRRYFQQWEYKEPKRALYLWLDDERNKDKLKFMECLKPFEDMWYERMGRFMMLGMKRDGKSFICEIEKNGFFEFPTVERLEAFLVFTFWNQMDEDVYNKGQDEWLKEEEEK
jgi:hypothetical protein